MDVEQLFGTEMPVIGMLHAPPLPGSPGSDASVAEVRERVLSDARAMEEGGADGILLENYGDAPYYPDEVPAHTTAHMAVLARDLRQETDLPLGVNVLRNDAEAALAVAAAAAAEFVRVNVLIGARVTDQGILEGRAHRVLRLRRRLGADVRIFGDVAVKHSSAVSPRPLRQEVAELVARARADAVVVTGPATGRAPEVTVLEEARGGAGEAPVFVGSGVTPTTAGQLAGGADGVIVGTALKRDGAPGNPVERDRVERLVAAVRQEG